MSRSVSKAGGALGLAVLALVAPPTVNSHEATPGTPARLGEVHFKVDCNAEAQKQFDIAIAYFHSFAWGYINEPLDRTLKADASCGMAHWGRALALLNNPFGWPNSVPPKSLADGAAALDAARTTGLKTARERDYVEALSAFYRDADKLNHRTRAKALETEFEKVAQRYPEDREATILHALFLSANFDPTDKQYTNQLRAARLLEPIFKELPQHPGVAHYLIHSYDYPPIAHHGLEAARRYSKIAPDASHALHMPSHIFTRLGAWRDSVESNRASAKSDAAKGWNALHAYDYMVYAHLQMNQDQAARQAMTEALALPKKEDHAASAYSYGAMPARLALERGLWAEAANLELSPSATSDYPWKKYPYAEAVNAFARGIGAAKTKDSAKAMIEVKRLQQLRDDAAALKIAYWADQIDIQAQVVTGLAAIVDGRNDEGLAALKQAASREDATEKHVVTPGPIVPAREVLAGVLLDQGDAAGALAEFESVLKREPNRLRATIGAAQAAEKLGDQGKARAHYTKVIELTESADSARPEVLHARRVAGRG